MRDHHYLRWPKRLLFLGVLGGLAGYGGRYWLELPEETPQWQTAKVTRGEVAQAITASGQLSPVVKVQVGSQVSGNIDKLFADFNSPVKEGQVLAELDPSTFQAYVHQAEGYLASAKASLELAQLSYQRSQNLRKDVLVSQSEHEKAQADLHQAEAAVRIHEGNLEKAKVDLARCTIYSPIDGIVISRNVDVGQTVAASLSAPTLFFIANDLARMQIEAHVSEADIGRIETGQAVKFTVDAFPEEIFSGKVTQIRNAPTNEQNVVTYETIIEVGNREAKLKPGMTANVSIIMARRADALKIPNAALRFHPRASRAKGAGLAASLIEAVLAPSGPKAEPSRKKDKRKSEHAVYMPPPPDGTPSAVAQPVQIKTGITDGKFTEVLAGLKEGDEVVIGMSAANSGARAFSSLLTGRKKKQ